MNFKIGIDNYGLYPLHLDPMETLQWALQHGVEGVAFSGLDDDNRGKCTPAYLKKMSSFALDHDLYIEWGGGQHIPRDLQTGAPKSIGEINRRAAEEASLLGTRIIRSCSGGLMRWDPAFVPTRQLMDEMAEFLSGQIRMLNDYQVVLAIETHFELTTFELIRVFEQCGVQPGGPVGICLDTMNLLTMLEDPVAATRRILPWVVSTHIKDGGLRLTDRGLQSYPLPIGSGIVNLKEIITLLATLPHKVHLSIEDHGGLFDLPVFNPDFLKEFPDLTTRELVQLLQLVMQINSMPAQVSRLPLQREEWPKQCDTRITQDIVALKKLVGSLTVS